MQERDVLLIVVLLAVVFLFNSVQFTGMVSQTNHYAERNPAFAHLFARTSIRQETKLPPYHERTIRHIAPRYVESLGQVPMPLIGGACIRLDGVQERFILTDANQVACV